MQINSLSSSYAQAVNTKNISIEILKKQQDNQKLEGQSAVKLIEESRKAGSSTEKKGTYVDLRV